MFGETTISYGMIWNHPIENTTMKLKTCCLGFLAKIRYQLSPTHAINGWFGVIQACRQHTTCRQTQVFDTSLFWNGPETFQTELHQNTGQSQLSTYPLDIPDYPAIPVVGVIQHVGSFMYYRSCSNWVGNQVQPWKHNQLIGLSRMRFATADLLGLYWSHVHTEVDWSPNILFLEETNAVVFLNIPTTKKHLYVWWWFE